VKFERCVHRERESRVERVQQWSNAMLHRTRRREDGVTKGVVRRGDMQNGKTRLTAV
jgi:hypothetical protein